MAPWNQSHQASAILRRYGFAVLCVAMALGLALTAQHYGFREVESPLFALAIVVTTWYAGIGPSALAVLLSTGFFAYFFALPLYSLELSS